MAKSFEQSAEERSVFLTPAEPDGLKTLRGERDSTTPMRGGWFIPIDRIQPDPHQPRKRFRTQTLNSLAESIRELGEIINPLAVEYNEEEDSFRIISGERRYRAAKMAGLEKLPCIIKEVDEKQRILLQLVANLQRENMTPLEESEAIKSIIDRFGYPQANVAKLLNKSESYISQILGLERLGLPAREILQTSEVAKEVQIRASREKDPQRQREILEKASQEGKTVRQIRAEGEAVSSQKPKKALRKDDGDRKWTWRPEDRRFVIVIQFPKKQNRSDKIQAIKGALEEAHRHMGDFVCGDT
jgi:ParB family chromosome partitioning protein